jgi:hypothetical protein
MSKLKRLTRKTLLNTLVRFDFNSMSLEHHSQYPFAKKEVLLFLGELPQMPGHCVVARKDGRIIWGYHTENFIVIPEEEI